jgi:hypothetical protein
MSIPAAGITTSHKPKTVATLISGPPADSADADGDRRPEVVQPKRGGHDEERYHPVKLSNTRAASASGIRVIAARRAQPMLNPRSSDA